MRVLGHLLALFGLAAILPAPAAAQAPSFLLQWGSLGSGNGQFNSPHGIAVDQAGSVFVADFGNNRIQKFGPSGEFLLQWGSSGSGDGDFYGPTGVAVDATGSVYVTENGSNSMVDQHRVQKFDNDGHFLAKWGALGHGPGEFNSPYGIAVAPNGNVYVADSGNDRIQIFTAEGHYISAWGTHGPQEGQFVDPLAIAIDDAGFVYVTERGFSSLGRLQRFLADGSSVTVLGTSGQFMYSFGVALAGSGNLYVVEAAAARIQKISPQGTVVIQWSLGPQAQVWGVAVDATENVYVVDAWGNRILKFGDLATPGTSSTWGRVKATYRD